MYVDRHAAQSLGTQTAVHTVKFTYLLTQTHTHIHTISAKHKNIQ